MLLINVQWEVAGGPVVRTQLLLLWVGPASIPDQASRIAQDSAPPKRKKKKKKKRKEKKF